MSSKSSCVLYETSSDGKVAYITLNRPEQLNAINRALPPAMRDAVARANADANVHCIVLRGAGRGFCGGYDLGEYAASAERGTTPGSQDVTQGSDAAVDYAGMWTNTECFMALHHSMKPTIAQVHGAAVAGGSDIALCCDLVVMADDARIGYPPARVWGVPTTAMWALRLGAERAKRMLFTGDLVSGKEAEAMGLVLKSVPAEQLADTVRLLTDRIKEVPIDQNWMNKRVINGFMDGQVQQAQHLATVFDGIARNSPAGIRFQSRAASQGFKTAIAERDQPGRTEAYMKRWKSVL